VECAVGERFYRFVRGTTAKITDFIPQGVQGKAMRYPGDAVAVRAWHEGISVYDEFESACEVAARIRFQAGRFIATIVLPPGHAVEIVQTGRNRHHYTIFADAETLLEYVEGLPVLIPGAPRG
jgi:hypothetical protein